MAIDRGLLKGHGPLPAIMATWGLLCAILLLTCAKNIAEGRFPDPDDALRLVQVRDLLGGQPWFDLHQYRIAPPEGSVMHWSRIVDLPLAAMILALTPLLGSAGAETVTLVAFPLLTLGAILLFVGRLAAQLFDRETAILACLCVGLIPQVVFQLQPMRIDHHGVQALCVAVGLWAIFRPSPIKGGAWAGLAMATGLMISIELLPLTAAFGGVLALRWLRDHSRRDWLVGYMSALALGLGALFLGTRGLGDLTQYCDTISPAHLAFFATAAAATALIARARHLHTLTLLALLAGAGLAGAAVFASLAPTCLTTPFASLDPLVREYWYINVLEGRPVWEQSVSGGLPALAQMLVALAATAAIWKRASGTNRDIWTDFALLFACAFLAGMLTFRSIALAGILAAIPLGWLARRLLGKWRNARRAQSRIASVTALCLVLQPSAPVALARTIAPGKNETIVSEVEKSSCDLHSTAPRLNTLAPATIFAPLDIGSTLLETTHHSVVATGHHRAEAAMRDVILAFTSPEDRARAIVESRQSDLLVICVDLGEPALFAKTGDEHSLTRLLMENNAPDWLEPVELGAPDSFRVYRVIR